MRKVRGRCLASGTDLVSATQPTKVSRFLLVLRYFPLDVLGALSCDDRLRRRLLLMFHETFTSPDVFGECHVVTEQLCNFLQALAASFTRYDQHRPSNASNLPPQFAETNRLAPNWKKRKKLEIVPISGITVRNGACVETGAFFSTLMTISWLYPRLMTFKAHTTHIQ